ncbi:ribonuclease J [Candidatus Nomurabacteria bacterium]|nr:ribonuclease J [Candidatus Nomurabacteria bacterium]MCB9820570.1 ribonuclease J [Candidatus Nomurabacteria bacterium]
MNNTPKPYHAVPQRNKKNHKPKQHQIKKQAPKDLSKVLANIKRKPPVKSGAPSHGPKAMPKRPKVAPRRLAPIRKRTKDQIPKVKKGVIRIVPLGGVEEIGKNMTAIEIGNDIIVVDAGMQFSGGDTPGIDYIIPNTTYLEENKDKIRAMIITHGHLDHIGGVPLVLSRIGNPPVYSRNLTVLLMKKRQAEFPHLPKLNAITVEKDQVIKCGDIKVRFWGVTHTIPDSMGIIIETEHGWIVNPGDYKLDQIDGVVTDSELKEYEIFEKNKVLLLMTDSTNIENEGFALPEVYVHEGLENLIKKVKGRMIIAAFASHITRLMHIIKVAESLNKKVALDGRSMKTNIEVSIEAGLIKPNKGTLIPIEEVDKYPPDRVIILMTGAQGEEFAALNRAANKTHKKFTLKRGDTVVLSASIVPGNEKSVQKLKDGLARQDVKIISYRTPGEDYVHATGHGNKEDIKWLHQKLKPKFFIPIHGHHFHLKLHKQLAMEIGMKEENIVVPDNGSVIEIDEKGEKIYSIREKAPAGPMMVDGFTVGDEQDVVIRDRQMLAEDGMFVIVATINTETGKLHKSPDIISRGFVYLKESQELLKEARFIIKRTIEKNSAPHQTINFDIVKSEIVDNIERFLVQSTGKRPLVIPVVLSV